MMQQEYFGIGSIKKLRGILSKENPQKVFLVTGKKSYQESEFKKDIEDMLSNYEVVHFNDFSINPKIEDVKKGIEIYRTSGCDFVIALGGGSVIDMAKTVDLLAVQNGEPEKYVKNELPLERNGNPFVAIPTTAGTGSEATSFAVVYINGKKYSFAHEDFILPDYAIIDPSLTFNLPKEITAATGMDALSQAIESYWSIGSNVESKIYASKAISLILQNLQEAVNNPTNKVREAMLESANLAGKAINISKTTACHAMSYTLTSKFAIPHGHAVSLTLGEMVLYNADVKQGDCLDKDIDLVNLKMVELYHLFEVENAEAMKNKINELMDSIGLKRKLKEFITSKKGVDYIVSNINPERMKNNPRKLTEKDVRQILERIW